MSTPSAETVVPVIDSHIVRTPGVCGGRPRINGTRIKVKHIYVWHELEGKTAAEIVAAYPHLTMGDVYAALAYFWDHRDEIAREMKDEEELVERLKLSEPSLLARKVAEQDAPNDPLPS